MKKLFFEFKDNQVNDMIRLINWAILKGIHVHKHTTCKENNEWISFVTLTNVPENCTPLINNNVYVENDIKHFLLELIKEAKNES